jgi:hypothetical protein
MSRVLWCATVLLFLPALTACGSSTAKGPAANAKQLDNLPVTVAGTTVDAPYNVSDPQCGPAVHRTVWYGFSRAKHGTVLVTLKAAGDLDAVVSVYRKEAAGELKLLRCHPTDKNGKVRFAFETNPTASTPSDYLLGVGQRVGSTPGSYHLAVATPSRPNNDERPGAVSLQLPALVTGSTLGSTTDEADPPCVGGLPNVWYRLDRTTNGRLVARLNALGDLDARVCVVRKARSQLSFVAARATGAQGNLSFSFWGHKSTTYYLIVGQAQPSVPGQFHLTVIAPAKPPVRPGMPLPTAGGTGHLDNLQNPADAWSVTLLRGVTYRIGVELPVGHCVRVSVFSPGTRAFALDTPIGVYPCGQVGFLTPGPDGGGKYSLLVEEKRAEATPYRLVVLRNQPDDAGPGVLLTSGQRKVGWVSNVDPLDLYRFDVPQQSDMRLLVEARDDVGIRLTDAAGATVDRATHGVKLIRTLPPGTYHVFVTRASSAANNASSNRIPRTKYRIAVLVRGLTTTELLVNGLTLATVPPETGVALSTFTTPYPQGGITRIEGDYFDIARQQWVFRRAWDIAPNTSLTFTPVAVGRWRLRATFNGTDVSAPSRSDYRELDVATVLTPET